MSKKNIYLLTTILASFVCIGYFGETEPRELLGVTLNIWVMRLAWLFIAASSFWSFWKLKEAEKSTD